MSLQIQNSVTLLYQPFASKVFSAIEECKRCGIHVYIFEGYRSPERQDLLFNQKTGATDAKAWSSWHQYGLAVDMVFGGPGKWSWVGPYAKVRKIFFDSGLRGLNKDVDSDKDAGHFEFDHELSITNAKKIALTSGILSVWNEIELMQKNKVH